MEKMIVIYVVKLSTILTLLHNKTCFIRKNYNFLIRDKNGKKVIEEMIRARNCTAYIYIDDYQIVSCLAKAFYENNNKIILSYVFFSNQKVDCFEGNYLIFSIS